MRSGPMSAAPDGCSTWALPPWSWSSSSCPCSLSCSIFSTRSCTNSSITNLAADVIPREVFGRYTSTIRVASLGAGSIFSIFNPRYIEIRTEYIYCGGAILCVLGFGLMCWKVREGQYPPPAKNLIPTTPGTCASSAPFGSWSPSVFAIPSSSPSSSPQARWIRFSEAAGMVGYIYYYRKYLHIPQAGFGQLPGILCVAGDHSRRSHGLASGQNSSGCARRADRHGLQSFRLIFFGFYTWNPIRFTCCGF